MCVFDNGVFGELAEKFEPDAWRFDAKGLPSIFYGGFYEHNEGIKNDYDQWKPKKKKDDKQVVNDDEQVVNERVRSRLLGKYLTYIIARLYIHNSPDEPLDFLKDRGIAEDTSQNLAEYAKQWWEVNAERLQNSFAGYRYHRLENAYQDLIKEFNKPLSQITKRELSRFIFAIREDKTLPTTAGRYELLEEMFGEETISQIAFDFSASTGFGQTIQRDWMNNNRIDFNGTNWIDLFSALNHISSENDKISPLFKDDAREKIAGIKYLLGCEDKCRLYMRNVEDICAYYAILECKTQAWYKRLVKKLNEALCTQEIQDRRAKSAEKLAEEGGVLDQNTNFYVYEALQESIRRNPEEGIVQLISEHPNFICSDEDVFCYGRRPHHWMNYVYAIAFICWEKKREREQLRGQNLNEGQLIEFAKRVLARGDLKNKLYQIISDPLERFRKNSTTYGNSKLYKKIEEEVCLADFDRAVRRNKEQRNNDYKQNRRRIAEEEEENLRRSNFLLTHTEREFHGEVRLRVQHRINGSDRLNVGEPWLDASDNELSWEQIELKQLRAVLLCVLVESNQNYGKKEINRKIQECGFIQLSPSRNPFDWYINEILIRRAQQA